MEAIEKAIHGGERGGWPPAWIGMDAAGDGEENASVRFRCLQNSIFLKCEWMDCPQHPTFVYCIVFEIGEMAF